MIGSDKSIRERAYEIWEAEGRPEGREAEHWQQASVELSEIARESGSTSATGIKGKAKPAGKTVAKPKAGAEKTTSRSKDRAQAKDSDVSTVDRDAAVLGAKSASSRKRKPS